MATPLPATDPRKSELTTVGKDRRLGYAAVTPQDFDFQSDTRSAFMPLPPSLVRNYFKDWQDVEPINTPRFGSKVQFKFGNEGYALLYGLELIVKMPRLGIRGATSTLYPGATENAHPQEADGTAAPGLSYAGSAAASGTYLSYQPYIGEFLFGGHDDTLRQKHATETLRDYRPIQAHVKRRLVQNSEGTARRTAYDSAVKATDADNTVATAANQGLLAAEGSRYFIYNVWCSWMEDAVNYHQMLPIHAAGLEKEIEFRIPPLNELVQSDVDVPTTVVACNETTGAEGEQPEIFLRCHYVTPEAAERALFANMTLNEGLSYMTQHSVCEQQYVTGDAGAHTAYIDLESFQNPVVGLAVVVRHVDDVKRLGETADSPGADSNVPPRAPAGTVAAPNWTRFQPINAISLYDGSQRVTPAFAAEYWNESQFGFVNHFKSAIGSEIKFLPLSISPDAEGHGLGHISLSSFQKARLRVDLPALADVAEEDGGNASRVVDIIGMSKNLFHFQQGQMIRVWNEGC